jgi:hypothetical protein
MSELRLIPSKTVIDGYLIEAVCKGCPSECILKFKATDKPDDEGEQFEGACWVDAGTQIIFTVTTCKMIKIEVP